MRARVCVCACAVCVRSVCVCVCVRACVRVCVWCSCFSSGAGNEAVFSHISSRAAHCSSSSMFTDIHVSDVCVPQKKDSREGLEPHEGDFRSCLDELSL